MKLLVVGSWSTEHSKEVNERWKQRKQKGKWRDLYPFASMIGRNKSFHVVELDDIAELYKDLRDWVDLETFEIIPLEDPAVLYRKMGS
jgi:hypothetical protein